MKKSDYKTILKEETISALGVILGAVIGLVLDDYKLGLFIAAGLLLITRAATCIHLKKRNIQD